jgi:hypothetical protein
MATLEELKREYARLKAEKEVRADFARRDREKKALASKVRQIKYARAHAIGKALKKGTVRVGTAIAKEARKSQRKRKSKPTTRRSTRSYSYNGNPFGIKAPKF